MVGDDDLVVSKPLTKELDGLLIVGRREGKPSDSIEAVLSRRDRR